MSSPAYIISAYDISREGLIHILRSEGFDVLGSYANVEQMEHFVSPLLGVIDEPDPLLQGKAVEEFKSRAPESLPVILSEQFDMEAMVSCFQAGAQGYIVKSMRSQPLMTALRLASLGEKVMPSDLVAVLNSNPALPSTDHAGEVIAKDTNLSERELDVLCLLMAGYPNKLIARDLDVCEATVKVHVKSILRKLKVSNRTQAAIWASSNGLSRGGRSLPEPDQNLS